MGALRAVTRGHSLSRVKGAVPNTPKMCSQYPEGSFLKPRNGVPETPSAFLKPRTFNFERARHDGRMAAFALIF